MNQSESVAELTADDIVKLNSEKMGSGCLWVAGIPAALVVGAGLLVFSWQYDYSLNTVIVAAVIVIPILAMVGLYKFIKNKDGLIDRDIRDKRKNVITAPITEKRIDSSEITRGRKQGGIEFEYYMTVAGKEFKMTEHKYLTIPVGEFMEIHQAPNSGIIVQERWLKKDGTTDDGN